MMSCYFIPFWKIESENVEDQTHCQSTNFRELAFHFNTSLCSYKPCKGYLQKMGIKYSISSRKTVLHNSYMLQLFIFGGLNPTSI